MMRKMEGSTLYVSPTASYNCPVVRDSSNWNSNDVPERGKSAQWAGCMNGTLMSMPANLCKFAAFPAMQCIRDDALQGLCLPLTCLNKITKPGAFAMLLAPATANNGLAISPWTRRRNFGHPLPAKLPDDSTSRNRNRLQVVGSFDYAKPG